jgi:hypothetical protein
MAGLLALATFPAHGGSVQLLDGTFLEGDLGLENGIVVRGGKIVRVPFKNVLRATFDEPKGEEFQPGLVLTNGTRIAGTFTSLAETTVKCEPSGIRVPGSEIAWAIYQPFGPELATQVPRGKMGALLRGGDFFEGTVKSGDAGTAKVLNPIFGPRVFDAQRKEMQALVLRDLKPVPVGFEVVTANGSAFAALDLIVHDTASVVLRHPLYDGMKVDLKNLVEIRAGPTRFASLDAVKPSRVDPPAGRTADQSFSAGKTLDGSPLQIATKGVRGFESLAGAVVTWDMPPGGTTFTARVAASPATPAAQKLIFSVYADGKAISRSGLLGAGDAPAVLRCVLPAAAKLLSVRTEGLAGAGVWAEPVVLTR